jgi:hypothetical protein
MRRWVLAAGLLAAAVTSPALAEDLDGVPPAPWKGGAYGDPRYSPQGAPPPGYADEDDDQYEGQAPQKRYSDAPPVPPRKYSDVPPGYAPAPPPRGACVRSEQVRERLTSEGWRDFHDGKAASPTLVTMRARRPNGRLFELQLDRCSGAIVEVRALELRPFGPYAYQQEYGPYGRWRWGQETAPYAYGGQAPYAYNGPWRERPYRYGGQWRWWND